MCEAIWLVTSKLQPERNIAFALRTNFIAAAEKRCRQFASETCATLLKMVLLLGMVLTEANFEFRSTSEAGEHRRDRLPNRDHGLTGRLRHNQTSRSACLQRRRSWAAYACIHRHRSCPIRRGLRLITWRQPGRSDEAKMRQWFAGQIQNPVSSTPALFQFGFQRTVAQSAGNASPTPSQETVARTLMVSRFTGSLPSRAWRD